MSLLSGSDFTVHLLDLGSFYTCCHGVCIWACYSPGDNNEKTSLFYYLRLRFEHGRHGGTANRGEEKSHTIPVGTDIYVCLPYTLTVKKKKEQKQRRKKKETDDQKKIKQNKAKRKNLYVTPLGQSELAHYLRYFIKYV